MMSSALVPHNLRSAICGESSGSLAGLTCVLKDMYAIAGAKRPVCGTRSKCGIFYLPGNDRDHLTRADNYLTHTSRRPARNLRWCQSTHGQHGGRPLMSRPSLASASLVSVIRANEPSLLLQATLSDDAFPFFIFAMQKIGKFCGRVTNGLCSLFGDLLTGNGRLNRLRDRRI